VKPWTMDEALTLIRMLQPESRRFNFHLLLGGGVLNKGQSEKDLDLYFMPMAKKDEPESVPNPNGLKAFLENLWGSMEPFSPFEVPPGYDDDVDSPTYGEYTSGRVNTEYGDDEQFLPVFFKGKFDYDGKRIDAFILGRQMPVPVVDLANGALDEPEYYYRPNPTPEGIQPIRSGIGASLRAAAERMRSASLGSVPFDTPSAVSAGVYRGIDRSTSW
jgi:hypothetical protein